MGVYLEDGAAGRGDGAAARQVGAHARLVGDGGCRIISLQLAAKRKEHTGAARGSARIDEEYLQPCMMALGTLMAAATHAASELQLHPRPHLDNVIDLIIRAARQK